MDENLAFRLSMTEARDMPNEHCAVCGFSDTQGLGMSRLVIEGRSLCLCRAHATTVATEMPETFEEMRALFIGVAFDRAPIDERRSPITRRGDEDRRVFPPRPEGRRRTDGRRNEDPPNDPIAFALRR